MWLLAFLFLLHNKIPHPFNVMFIPNLEAYREILFRRAVNRSCLKHLFCPIDLVVDSEELKLGENFLCACCMWGTWVTGSSFFLLMQKAWISRMGYEVEWRNLGASCLPRVMRSEPKVLTQTSRWGGYRASIAVIWNLCVWVLGQLTDYM